MSEFKVFISYSWSSKEHEAWVLRLATELRGAGVDAIIDKWDLNEGDEANSFMEGMVADPNVKKVIIVCDAVYKQKADTRIGGAGTEAQIISSEIFKEQQQDKFVVLSTELGEDGEPLRPAYYTSRIFIPFFDSAQYQQSFDQLLRWIFNKPANRKPPLGSKPSFLDDSKQQVQLATDVSLNRALEAVKSDHSNARALTVDFLVNFSSQLEKFRWPKEIDYLSDAVLRNFDDFLPYRNQFLSLVAAIARNEPKAWHSETLHDFFESILPYFFKLPEQTSWKRIQFDNFKLFGREMFLFTVAILLREKRFEMVANLLSSGYYVVNGERSNPYLGDFTEFCMHLGVLDHRNQELGLRRLSIFADMIKDRSGGSGVSHVEVMQADFIIYLRSQIEGKRWWPETLVYVANWFEEGTKFEIFVRGQSRSYFQNILTVLGLNNKSQFDSLVNEYIEGKRTAPRWDFDTVNVASLSNAAQLCTLP